MMVSLFPNITVTTDGAVRPLPVIFAGIRNGHWRDHAERVRAVVPEGFPDERAFKAARAAAKKPSPYFTVSGTFPANREDDGIDQHSGVVALDIDKQQVDRAAIEADPYTLATFVSIGGNGICILCRIPADATAHAGRFRALRAYYESSYGLRIDSLADVSRPRFVSYDPDAYWNEAAHTWRMEAKPEAPAPKPRPTVEWNAPRGDGAPLLKWIADEIAGAVEKHNTLNRVAFTAGGWVAAARCDEHDARLALRHAIEQRSDVVDMRAAYKTIEDGLEAGKSEPLHDTRPPLPSSFNQTAPPKPTKVLSVASDDCLPTAATMWPRLLALRRAPTPPAETTHMGKVDEHFRWVRGKLIAVTGWPGHGKTEWVTHAMLAKSIRSGWRWIVFSPEAASTERMVNQWIETWTGRHTNPHYPGCLPERDHELAMEQVLRFMQPLELAGAHTVDAVMAGIETHLAKELAEGREVHGLMIDPWNKLAHQYGGLREDLYIGQILQRFKRFAAHNPSTKPLCFIVVVHPSGDQRNPKTLELIRPVARNLQGGAEWERQCDDILCVIRPNIYIEPKDTTVLFVSFKIRDQKQSMCIQGEVYMRYNRSLSRYFGEDGAGPFPPPWSSDDEPPPPALPPSAPAPPPEREAPDYRPHAGLSANDAFDTPQQPEDPSQAPF